MSVLVGAGCAHQTSQLAATRGEVPHQPAASITIFFVDGLDSTRFEQLLSEGKLPHLRSRFVEGGVGVRAAVASLPAVTYANAATIITGRFPGHHGILGNIWFDRAQCLLRDYGYASTYRQVNDDLAAPTFFDLLDDKFTVSVQAHTRRGADVTIDNWAASGIDWFLRDYSDVDARVGQCFPQVATAARRAGRWPALYYNYFPGIDEIGHHHGSASTEYAEALMTVDAAIGSIIADVEAANIAERRYYVLLSDHGHVPLRQSSAKCETTAIDLVAWLEIVHGRKVRVQACQQNSSALRHRLLAGVDTVLITSASRCAVIHLRGAGGWHALPTKTEIEQLVHGSPEAAPNSTGIVHLPQVLIACYRDGPDAVRAVGRNGSARIERRAPQGVLHYRMLVDGDAHDPLGYREEAALRTFVDAGWHDSRAWLKATANTRVPDFVPQVLALFDSPRAGDIVAFADEDHTFEPKWRGGHGSCLARDMRVPLYFSGPGLPAGREIPTGRLVDVMPTVLDLLGFADRLKSAPPIDGISLLPALRAAD